MRHVSRADGVGIFNCDGDDLRESPSPALSRFNRRLVTSEHVLPIFAKATLLLYAHRVVDNLISFAVITATLEAHS